MVFMAIEHFRPGKAPLPDEVRSARTKGRENQRNVPVLIIEGTFDAATAPGWVNLITPDLKNAQVVPFPFTGHSVLGKSKCAPSIMAAFLDKPTKPVDRTCAAQTTLTFTR